MVTAYIDAVPPLELLSRDFFLRSASSRLCAILYSCSDVSPGGGAAASDGTVAPLLSSISVFDVVDSPPSTQRTSCSDDSLDEEMAANDGADTPTFAL